MRDEEVEDCLLTGREVRAEREEDSCSWCGYPAAAHPGNYPVKKKGEGEHYD